MDNSFATMLMSDAISLSIASPEAMQKLNEPEKAVIVNFPRRRHHTVQERRKWDAKAKAYIRPECGLWPSKIRELKALMKPGADELVVDSEKDFYHELHMRRSHGVCSREDARRDRHPKASIEAAMYEFEVESGRLELEESFDVYDPEPLNYVEYLQCKNDPSVFSEDDSSDILNEMNDLISRGDLYFPPQGGMFVASSRAFGFICQHQEEVLALIS